MPEVRFYPVSEVDDALLKFAVIVSRYNGRWVLCKHKQRQTWEVPGGRREDGEAVMDTAQRELFEETGAIGFDLTPVCVYVVISDVESFGLLCYAQINELAVLPETEIERIELFDELPQALTYPLIQPKLMEKVKEVCL